jgi:nicotinate phosphoribosyltransferase
MGITKCGIRIDSGDITYLSKKCRKLLDAAGLTDCKIIVSNSLDEYIIRDLLMQGAPVDAFGVGERLITSRSEPVFGGVYKLCAIEKDGQIIPKMKISENIEKITNPSCKKVYRLYDNETGKAGADLLALYDEEFDDSQPIELFDPNASWKRKTFTDYTLRELLVPVVQKGKVVYSCPDIKQVQKYCLEQIDTLWDEVTRFENPHTYYVDLSQKLWDLKQQMLAAAKKKK